MPTCNVDLRLEFFHFFVSDDPTNFVLLLTQMLHVSNNCSLVQHFTQASDQRIFFLALCEYFQLDNVEIRGKKGSLHFIRFPTAEMGSFLLLARSKGSEFRRVEILC